jgi:hypothetical protein
MELKVDERKVKKKEVYVTSTKPPGTRLEVNAVSFRLHQCESAVVQSR